MWDIKINVQNSSCKYPTNRNSEGESEFAAGQGTCSYIFRFVDVVKNIFSFIIFESQFVGYSPSEKDNSRDSLKV